MRFGLALSGGALRGAAHIGVLKALEENRLFPSWISGASAGSIVASLYSIGYTPGDMEKIALTLKNDLFDPSYAEIILGLVKWVLGKQLPIDGIIKGNKVKKLVDELTKGCGINEVRVPLAITAVDINNGQTIMFVSNKNGLKDTAHIKYIDDVKIADAVRASIAIPVIFKPFFVHGMRLVDGGVNDGMPITVLKDMGAPKVVGINLGYSGQMRKGVDNIVEIGNQTIDIMAYQITRYTASRADCIINPHIYDVGLADFDKIPECMEKGYEAVVSNLEMIKRAIKT